MSLHLRVWLIIALLAFLEVGAGAGCRRAPAEGRADVPPENQVRLSGVVMDRFSDGALESRARIERLSFDRVEGLAEGQMVILETDQGVRIEAPSTDTELKTKRTRFTGGVVITDSLGRKMRTQTLRYDSGKDWIESEGTVTIEGKNFQAKGQKLQGHPKGGQLEVQGPIEARFSPGPSPP